MALLGLLAPSRPVVVYCHLLEVGVTLSHSVCVLKMIFLATC